jgi:hypothetical protein
MAASRAAKHSEGAAAAATRQYRGEIRCDAQEVLQKLDAAR